MQHIVSTPAALSEIASHLTSANEVGLDTEFMRERTYRAELCLVQVATNERAACIDPLALPDLAAMATPLTSARPIKVMHASRQDLEVLLPVVGLVTPLFDTQTAAALTGLPTQIGYGDLVKRVLGQELAKSHTRTDWMRRPLSPEQIEYALDDVRYLLPLKAQLEEQLDKLGRLSWLREELATLEEARTYTTVPEQAWLRVKGLRGLDPARTHLARELAAWRERRAMERNRPRGWILDDLALREIVLQVPRTVERLAAISGVQPGLVKHCAEEILALVEAAGIPDPPPPLSTRARPVPAQTALVKKLSEITQATAVSLGLSPELLATRRDLEQLAEGKRDLQALRGWRREVIGERLLSAL